MDSTQQSVVYVPSSSETKKALLLYLFLGIMVSLVKKEVSVYEIYHIQQSIGWWIVFIGCFIGGSILWFVPYVYMIVWIPFVLLIGLWVYFVRQARNGQYVAVLGNSPLGLFVGLGQRMLFVFDFHFVVMDGSSVVTSDPQSVSSPTSQ